MSSLAVSNSSYGPFPDRDTFQYYSVKYLDPSDIARASRVCKHWNQLFSDQNLWKALFEKEGIPLVISTNGSERNYKEDFKILYPITISGKIMSQYLGKVVEKIPPMTEKQFKELEEPDPFEEGKLKRETFVFIVDPSFVMRTINQETSLALYDLRNLNLTESSKQESEQSEMNTTRQQTLNIPLSLKNIKVLASYPLKGKENIPVFNYFNAIVLQQCNTCPDQISVYFMRKQVVGRGMRYEDQENLVKDKGFEVPSLRVRVLFDTISILKNGTCPDGRWAYSRHPEITRYNNAYYYHSTVGGFFAPRTGVNIDDDYYDYFDSLGVVAGRPAEAPSGFLNMRKEK